MVQPVPRRCASWMLGAFVLLLTALTVAPAPAQAHGGLTNPPTRTYVCRFLEPDAKQCHKAWGAESQSMYDWMEVNISAAKGRHRALIPDGQLCGAGRAKYAAFDAATDAWPSTPVKAGPMEMTYTSVAPHATSYYRLYLTKPGFDIATPLRWDDLELIYDSGPRPAAAMNRFPVTLPERSGHHILYLVWQRSDSPEAFYGCSDVVYPTTPPGPTPLITHFTTTDPEAGGEHAGHGDHAPAPAPPKAKPTTVRRGPLAFSTTITTDWGAGACASVRVKNHGRRAVRWRGTLRVSGTITSLWSARGRARDGRLTVRGMPFNARLRAKASTTFGYCVQRR